MSDYHPHLRPLVSDIGELAIGSFLASSEYERLAIRQGFGQTWHGILNYVQSNRLGVILGFDHRPGDSVKGFLLIINEFYKSDTVVFNKLLYSTLKGFINWNNNEIDLSNIFEDLELLEFPKDWLEDLRSLYLKKVRLILDNKKLDSKFDHDRVDEEFVIKEQELLKAQKASWIQLLSKAEIEKVIDEVQEHATKNNDSGLLENMVNLSSRYHRVKNKAREGIIDFDAETLEMNKVNKSLIETIKAL